MPAVNIDQALKDAFKHFGAEELPQAQGLCKQILRHDPTNPDALHMLGIITAKSGNPRAAIDLIRRAIIQKSDWPQAHYHLGNLLHQTGQREEAVESYRRAVALNPKYLQAQNNLGVALRELGRFDEAIAVITAAIALNPTDAYAHTNLGNLYKDKGDLKRSIAAFREAIIFNPNLAEAHNNLAAALKELGDLDESVAECRRAIALQPHFAEAHNNLGTVLEEIGELDEAVAALSHAVALRPNYDQAHYNLGNALKDRGQIEDSIAAYRRAIAIRPSFVEAHTNLVYAMHFSPAYDAAAIAEELRRWNHQHAEPFRQFIQPPTNDRNANRRLRVGYVSPDFKEHPVGRFLLPLLANHDKQAFEIFAYAQVPISDAVTETLRSHADTWRDITGMKDSKVAELIQADKIDILVDLTMHMARNRLQMFARKPAPVQLSWLAYCSTTGMDTVDYRFSDPYLDPKDSKLSVYSERTIRLDGYWCYQPIDSPSRSLRCSEEPDGATKDPALRNTSETGLDKIVDSLACTPLPSLANHFITFGSLNNFAKVSRSVLEAWTKLLQAVPNSNLLLHSLPGNHRQLLLDQLQKDGIDPGRIQFVGKLPMREYLKLYHRIDIALDTFPYGGGTTTCDALWMGVPVVSLIGKTAVGRGGSSILSHLGLPELVANSTARYIEIATELANDPPRLSQLRSTLRQRMQQSPLTDAPRYARNIEAAYRRMWLSFLATDEQR